MNHPDWPDACRRPWYPIPAYAAPTPELVAAVTDIWRWADAEAAALGAECRACGQCCDFARAGHILFGTGAELDVFIFLVAPHFSADAEKAGAALAAGRCPFWRQERCTARASRLIGCRVYYCDPRASQKLLRIGEESLARLEAAAGRHGRRHWYGPALEYVKNNMSYLKLSAGPDKADVST
jgi:hypothetical protein